MSKEELRNQLLKGNIAETYFRWKLMEEGYRVAKIVKTGKNKKTGKFFPFLNLDNMEMFIFKHYEGDKEKLINLFKKDIWGLPDFICLRDGKISFIEIKSNDAGIQEKQKKVFKKIQNLGYKVQIKRLKVDLNIEEINDA